MGSGKRDGQTPSRNRAIDGHVIKRELTTRNVNLRDVIVIEGDEGWGCTVDRIGVAVYQVAAIITLDDDVVAIDGGDVSGGQIECSASNAKRRVRAIAVEGHIG